MRGMKPERTNPAVILIMLTAIVPMLHAATWSTSSGSRGKTAAVRTDVLPDISYSNGHAWLTWLSKHIANPYYPSRVMLSFSTGGSWIRVPSREGGPRGTVQQGKTCAEWHERPSVLATGDHVWVFWYERRHDDYQNTDIAYRVFDTRSVSWTKKLWVTDPAGKDKDPRPGKLSSEGVRLVWQSQTGTGIEDLRPNRMSFLAVPVVIEESEEHDESFYETEVASRSTGARRVTGNSDYRVLFGDLHCHTSFSDGEMMPHHVLLFARDVAHVDFSTITDHDRYGGCESMHPYELKISQLIAGGLSDSSFIGMAGYEWTCFQPGVGHRNIVFSDNSSMHRSSAEYLSDTLEELFGIYDTGSPTDPIIIPHHLSSNMHGGISWDTNPINVHLTPVIEIASKHGRFEYFGCPGEHDGAVPGSDVQDALAENLKLGIVASSDTHNAASGTLGNTGLLVSGFGVDEIFEAIRSRRTFAATGDAKPVVILGCGEVLMGSETTTPADPILDISVWSCTAVDSIEVVKHIAGDETYPFPALVTIVYGDNRTMRPGSSVPVLIEEDRDPSGGTVYRVKVTDTLFSTGRKDCLYYVRVNLFDGNQAWSSPLWISYGPVTKEDLLQ